MKKYMRYLKREMDVEFFSCVHAMSMVFMFGFLLFVQGNKSVDFLIIFEMFLLGYLIAWFQKLLFLKEKVYGTWEKRMRIFLWNVGPVLLQLLAGRIGSWYHNLPGWIEWTFALIMICYYVMIYVALRVVYQDETRELNQMLEMFKLENQEDKTWE